MKTAVIYARYSSERQTEQSIEGQLRICHEFAGQNDLAIVDTYIDRAMTGTNDNRAAFQRMLSDSDKAKWDIVLVYALDRFGRNSIEVAVNKQRLQKNGVILISATQRTAVNIDGSKNLDGIILENVLIGLSEYYSAELSQKIRRGLHESREKGFYSGGTVPYGYYVKDKRVYVDEERAKIVRYIYQEYLSGKIVREIIGDLTKQGVLYKGKPFVQNTVYKILRLEKYIGVVRYEEDGVYNNIFPQIVPKETFDAIQLILEKNKIGSRSESTDFLLRSKLICGYCGRNLQGDSGTSRHGYVKHYYKCMGRKRQKDCQKSVVPKEKLENLILDTTQKIFGIAENREYLADLVMQVHEKRLHDQSVLKMLKEDKEQTEKSIANIMSAIEQGILTHSTKSRLNELEDHLQETNEKILIEQSNEQQRLKKSDVIEYLKHTIKKEPKLLIQMLIQKIIIYDDKIEIYYNYTDKKSPDNDSRDSSFIEGSDVSNQSPPAKQRNRCAVFSFGRGDLNRTLTRLKQA
jgi:DNA invertase Pin-like site-specific DNA recombinase